MLLALGDTMAALDADARPADVSAAAGGFVAASTLLPTSSRVVVTTPLRPSGEVAATSGELSDEQQQRIAANRAAAMERRRRRLAERGAGSPSSPTKKARIAQLVPVSLQDQAELHSSLKRREVCHLLHFCLCQLRAQCQRVLGREFLAGFDKEIGRIDPRGADDVVAQSQLMGQFFAGPARGDKVTRARGAPGCVQFGWCRLTVPTHVRVCVLACSGCRGTRYWAATSCISMHACTRTIISRTTTAYC
eukprot:COSAG02_NODE_1026_length_15134_cov_382.979714_9_plen_249_part_00